MEGSAAAPSWPRNSNLGGSIHYLHNLYTFIQVKEQIVGAMVMSTGMSFTIPVGSGKNLLVTEYCGDVCIVSFNKDIFLGFMTMLGDYHYMPLLAGDCLNLLLDVEVNNHMFCRGNRARCPTFRVRTHVASGTRDIVLDFAGSGGTDENRMAVLLVAGGGIRVRAGRDRWIQFGDMGWRVARAWH
jgi:hypothetical protein